MKKTIKIRIINDFKKQILNMDRSIQASICKSYLAFHIKKGLTFIRIYPKKTTFRLPFEKISARDKKFFNIRDNSRRYPRHELQTKTTTLKEKHLSPRFMKVMKRAFEFSKKG